MAVAAVSGSGTLLSSGKSLAGSFDTFLQLLTVQLQQQDPLSPMDSTEFTNQLVQFASVEQQIEANDQLGRLNQLMQSSSLTSGLGYLGTDVVAELPGVRLGSSGDAAMPYALEDRAAKLTVTVLDAAGRTVLRRELTDVSPGARTFTWDGRGGTGLRQPAGDYRVTIEAVDTAGAAVAVDRAIRGTITGIEPGATGLQVVVSGNVIPTTAIREVSRPSVATSPSSSESSP